MGLVSYECRVCLRQYPNIMAKQGEIERQRKLDEYISVLEQL